jgi:TPR repeat protein
MKALCAAIALLLTAGCSEVPGDAALAGGHPKQAAALYESEYKAGSTAGGLRPAGMLANDLGMPRDEKRALAIWKDLAGRGVPAAQHNLGFAYETGIGTAVDYAKAEEAYRAAADAGWVVSLFNLGAMYSKREAKHPDDVAGLAYLLKAQRLIKGSSYTALTIREDRFGHIRQMKARMTPDEIARAEAMATK